jgi:hypothetical protein
LPIAPILVSLPIKHANQQVGEGEMKLFISVDMEGTTGLERLEEIFRGLPGFDTFRQLMAGDCNAVIQGAIEGGASRSWSAIPTATCATCARTTWSKACSCVAGS